MGSYRLVESTLSHLYQSLGACRMCFHRKWTTLASYYCLAELPLPKMIRTLTQALDFYFSMREVRLCSDFSEYEHFEDFVSRGYILVSVWPFSALQFCSYSLAILWQTTSQACCESFFTDCRHLIRNCQFMTWSCTFGTARKKLNLWWRYNSYILPNTDLCFAIVNLSHSWCAGRFESTPPCAPRSTHRLISVSKKSSTERPTDSDKAL